MASEANNGEKRPRDGELVFFAKKSVGGVATTTEFAVSADGAVKDLAARIAEHEGCQAVQVTLVHKGAVLGQPAAPLQAVADKEGSDKITVVYIVRKPAGAAVAVLAAAAATPAAAAAAPASAAAAPVAAAPAASSSAPAPLAASGAAPSFSAAPGSPGSGLRVLLLMRHGQCCHEDEGDELKALTDHGHRQAENSAQFVKWLFDAGKVPAKRALLHSTSRRARETAAKLPQHLPGLEVWNADILRETNPSSNPLRAEEVFLRLFLAPQQGEADTLAVVAHNNIILYLLMRAAGVPIERAAQAWRLFHLRHASVTRIEVRSTGAIQVVSVGAAAHIPHGNVTWNNIKGADMSAWKEGKPDRHKFSGRMIVLIRQADTGNSPQMEAIASHIRGLSEYMVSGHMQVVCTPAAEFTALAICRLFRTGPQVLPESIGEQPEAAFLQFFAPPMAHSRDTICMVADDGPVLYWLLRALQMGPDEARAASASYALGRASVTLVNIRNDGSMKVVTVGDTGHLPNESPPG